jgi:hypothetical protein
VTEYLPRSAWTSSGASGDTLGGRFLRGVAVHWPGTSQDVIGDPGQADIAERLRHYRSYHLGKGWRDIGYNVAIDQAGRVWMARSTLWHGNLVGAHCASDANPDANREYVGVLLLLGDREPLSPAMIRAFRDWYHNRFLPVWRDRFDVRGHGQVPGASTSCPGPYARALMGDLASPAPPAPAPAITGRNTPDMIVTKFGATRYRAIFGDRLVAISREDYDRCRAAGIPAPAFDNATVENLERILVSESDGDA